MGVVIEYRICWEANIGDGSGDWRPWEGPEGTIAAVEERLQGPEVVGAKVALPLGLMEALDLSGFGWYAQVRYAEQEGER